MEKMPLADIVVTNPYLRTQTDVDSLKKSIETIGLIHPLTVNDKNELIAGGRRYQALKELGKTHAQVSRLNLSDLEQELVSIDENLIRTPLSKLEFEQCLNRGRAIYEQLNPTANKVELQDQPLNPEEKKQAKVDEENDTTSFAAVTAEKTGLSKSIIKNAIRRDEKSSEQIKKARGAGEISASQVNEIIKLDKKEQEIILPYIKEKTVKDVRQIVEQAKKEGIDQAVLYSQTRKTPPKEIKQLTNLAKRCQKLLSKIMLEDMEIEETSALVEQMEELQNLTKGFIERYDFDEERPRPASVSSETTLSH